MDEGIQNLENALVHFVVKDYNRFGHNRVIGEALIKFDKINKEYAIKPFADVPQIELSLIKLVEVPQGTLLIFLICCK